MSTDRLLDKLHENDRTGKSPWTAYILSVMLFIIAYTYAPSHDTFLMALTIGCAFVLIFEGNARYHARKSHTTDEQTDEIGERLEEDPWNP